MTFAPQLVADAARVRAAQRLRGRDRMSLRGAWSRTAMPVLEGALGRSVELAAAMDSRGYGRTGDLRPAARHWTAALVLGGVLGVCVGMYGLLDASAKTWMGLPMLAVGCVLAAAGLVVGGRRTRRSRYRPDPWALPEWLVAGAGVATAACLFVLASRDPAAVHPPDPLAWPPVPVLSLVAIGFALLPAVLAPPQPQDAATPRSRPGRADEAEAGLAA
jgi:energy-coupling factor transport system permease protein